MRKLLTFALLTTLWSCSKPAPAAPRAGDSCRVPRPMIVDLAWHTCSGEVCLSVEDSILQARANRRMVQVLEALEACSLVRLTSD